MKIKILLLMAFVLMVVVLLLITGSKSIAEDTSIKRTKTHMISNAEFTNQNWTHEQVTKFVKHWKNNKLHKWDIKVICDAARKHRIHPLVVLTKMEQEQSMIRNYSPGSKNSYRKRYIRAMAYGLSIKRIVKGKKYYPHEGYYKQVTRGTKCLRKFYDKYEDGMNHPINYNKEFVYPENAATYSLYVYCPFYGLYSNHGITCRGNELFIVIYKEFKGVWNEVNPKSVIQDNNYIVKK
jgi:hypothetical protein